LDRQRNLGGQKVFIFNLFIYDLLVLLVSFRLKTLISNDDFIGLVVFWEEILFRLWRFLIVRSKI